MKRVLILSNVKDERNKKYIHYLRYAEHDERILNIKQSSEIVDLVENCHVRGGYIKIQIKSILALHSWYSVRLYLLFCQKLKAGSCSIDAENLRTILHCINNYKRQENFITRCVFEPLREINEKTEIKVKVNTAKRGRKIKSFYFAIEPRADRGDIREIIEDAAAERIEKEYPADYINYCLLLTKKIHDPKKGTASGLFLKLLKSNFIKWKADVNDKRAFLENKSKRVKISKVNNTTMTRAQYDGLPDEIRGIMDKSGGFSKWCTGTAQKA